MRTSDGLIKYVKSMVGNPYWPGAYGQKASESLEKKLRVEHKSRWMNIDDVSEDYGKPVHDASGLIKGYLWRSEGQPVYKQSEDLTSYGFYRLAPNNGKRDTCPRSNGMLVYKSVTCNTIGINHMGVYADGFVYECVPGKGVVKTKFDIRDWPFWSDCRFYS